MNRELCIEVIEAIMELIKEQENEHKCGRHLDYGVGIDAILAGDSLLIAATVPIQENRQKSIPFGEESVNFEEVKRALQNTPDFSQEKYAASTRPKALRITAKATA